MMLVRETRDYDSRSFRDNDSQKLRDYGCKELRKIQGEGGGA